MPTTYTDEQLGFLMLNYKKYQAAELTKMFNSKYKLSKNVNAISSLLSRKGFKSGRSGHFEKGCETWNKGKKGYMGANVTSFKKGCVPPNKKPLGAERACSKDGYVMIKVPQKCKTTGRETCYRPKHLVLWEKENGLVPSGFVVRFNDGDKMNFSLENLELASRHESLHLNMMGYSNTHPNLKPTVRAIAKIELKASKLTKP